MLNAPEIMADPEKILDMFEDEMFQIENDEVLQIEKSEDEDSGYSSIYKQIVFVLFINLS